MPGSKKGEHRGAANKNHVRTAPAEPKKPRKPRSAPVRTEEYYREVTRVVTGTALDDAIEPRELMLEAMRYFHSLANESRQHAMHIMRSLAQCETDADFQKVDQALAGSELRTREMYLLAVECGYKVAPYIHAKLASIEVSGPNKGPIEVMSLLLQEIASANADRPSWAPADLDLEAEHL